MEKEYGKNEDRIDTENDLKNIPLQTENIAFKPEEMIACEKCERTNPPTRLKCFYCGGELSISGAQSAGIRPNLRKLENWEKGYNLIYSPDLQIETNPDLAKTAETLGLETEILQKIFAVKTSLPVARTESEREAEIISQKLREHGFFVSVISDEALAADNLPTRLRGLEFDGEKIILIYFNSHEIAEIRREDLTLIVSGALFERKTESIEKRKKGESQILNATETASDEILIDIYSRENSNGCRILTKGFDFSCLGTEKGITSAENMKKLVARLRKFAPEAKFVGDYPAVREMLGFVWENEQKKESQGLKRRSFSKFDLSSVTTSSNLQQFTKYSRLQRQVL
ncbi:MAG TPA: hypothetical protein VF556_11460 [Pyrinomonadaceae bacterium]|jgi:hypothetical protein